MASQVDFHLILSLALKSEQKIDRDLFYDAVDTMIRFGVDPSIICDFIEQSKMAYVFP